MSTGRAVNLDYARQAAIELMTLLSPACDRIAIAGSIRRRKPQVHDLELVAIPTWQERPVADLWGDSTERVNALDEKIRALREDGVVSLRSVEVHRASGEVETTQRDGSGYKALDYVGLPVDLFITDADRWGAIFAIRTGPGDWNQRLVTDCKNHWRQVKEGRVLYHNRPVPTPEEEDFFTALGVPWMKPEDRDVDRLRFDPDLLRSIAV